MNHHKALTESGEPDPKRRLVDDLASILGDVSKEDRYLLSLSAGVIEPAKVLNVLSAHLKTMSKTGQFTNINHITNELDNLSVLFSKKE